METIRKIRLAYHRDKKPLHRIAREFRMSRNTVKKIIRSGVTELSYVRKSQPRPRLGPFEGRLSEMLAEEKPARERRTARVLFEELKGEGFEGGYDSVRRYVRQWRSREKDLTVKAFIPLVFDPGEAFQFDWSYEDVELGGVPVRVKVAQLRLCHSRQFFCAAYTRETLEMVLDSHVRAFEFFGGACRKGIYDNLKTVVSKVLMGKDRVFNRRFQSLASHYLFEPLACTPGAGWEKGQVENQVGFVRERFFGRRRKFADIEELNAWLLEECRLMAASHKHPEQPERTVGEVFEEERRHLLAVSSPFDAYAETPARVSSTALVCFDRNRYSVHASAVGKAAMVRAYADRIVIVVDGEVIGAHPRRFGRDKTVYDPWHYTGVLERKPGALRNGAPFRGWDLPEPLKQVRAALSGHSDADRQFVGILSAVGEHGLEAVTDACAAAIAERAVSRDVVLNILSRSKEPSPVTGWQPPPGVPEIRLAPIADCSRYDGLLTGGDHAP